MFGSELTAAYYEFLDARMQVDVASIEGGEIPWDPWSLQRLFKTEYDDRYLADPVLQAKAQNSLSIADVDFTQYDIVYLAGGWGAAYDLGYSEELGRKVSEAYAAGAAVGGVCHGLLGLLLATDQNGEPLDPGTPDHGRHRQAGRGTEHRHHADAPRTRAPGRRRDLRERDCVPRHVRQPRRRRWPDRLRAEPERRPRGREPHDGMAAGGTRR